MEKLHSITPYSTKNVRHIPGMYEPLKVGYHLSSYHLNSLDILSLIIWPLLSETDIITVINKRFSAVELYIYNHVTRILGKI